MSHTVSGQTTTYTWDVAAALPVVLQDNTYTYVYGLNLISATDASGNQNYYMHNGQGSVANIVDYNGTEKARYLYDAFGNTRYTLELTPNIWLYAGEQQDDGTGFYYLRARYYDPFLGRFITRDPVGEGNGYSYVFNNPVNFIDPYGLSICGDIVPDDWCEWVDNKAEEGLQKAGEAVNAVGDASETVYDEVIEPVGQFIGQALTPECIAFGFTLAATAVTFYPGITLGQALLAGTLIDVAGVAALCVQGHTEEANTNGAQGGASGILAVLDWSFNSGQQGAYTPLANEEWGPFWRGAARLASGAFAVQAGISCYRSHQGQGSN